MPRRPGRGPLVRGDALGYELCPSGCRGPTLEQGVCPKRLARAPRDGARKYFFDSIEAFRLDERFPRCEASRNYRLLRKGRVARVQVWPVDGRVSGESNPRVKAARGELQSLVARKSNTRVALRRSMKGGGI